ncbi:hypothetical protein DFH06DRAFT_1467017 [Mycena polygramma]|nr:hypothetical protein DFH06DRAFT_1467017 [Mycena polygramma]
MPRENQTYGGGPSAPPKSDTDPNRRATCNTCGTTVKRASDLSRHMLTHAKNKEELMFQCPFPDCGHKTLQRSNLETHIRTHTNARPLLCPVCDFATADPSSLHRHKRKHENREGEANRTAGS